MNTTIKSPSTQQVMIHYGKVCYSSITFGRYPQSGPSVENVTPIKWRVLAVNNNIALLAADRILDVMPYDETGACTWADCSLRSWLNNEFIQTAFTAEEQEAIQVTMLSNTSNPKYGTQGGPVTQDKIFLLSFEDLVNPNYGFSTYPGGQMLHGSARHLSFTEAFARTREMTAYGYLRQAYDDFETSTMPQSAPFAWWLRNSGGRSNYAMLVNANGCINQYGQKITIPEGVCPALRLDLTSDLWDDAGGIEI